MNLIKVIVERRLFEILDFPLPTMLVMKSGLRQFVLHKNMSTYS